MEKVYDGFAINIVMDFRYMLEVTNFVLYPLELFPNVPMFLPLSS